MNQQRDLFSFFRFLPMWRHSGTEEHKEIAQCCKECIIMPPLVKVSSIWRPHAGKRVPECIITNTLCQNVLYACRRDIGIGRNPYRLCVGGKICTFSMHDGCVVCVNILGKQPSPHMCVRCAFRWKRRIFGTKKVQPYELSHLV